MTTPRKPISFISTDDPEAALAFYSDVMGLSLIDASPFALVFDDGGVMLRIQIVERLEPAGYTAHGWQVADIEGAIAELIGKGVSPLRFEGMPQNDTGIWETPDGAKIAWFKDPSGNTLSFTEFAARP